jgi:phenylacetate-coenzyme A ligase PaaK-like adenylate-forming protein
VARPLRLGVEDLELGSGVVALSRELVRLMVAARRAEPERAKADQLVRFGEMVDHARRNVPMYSELYRDLPENEPPPIIDKHTIRSFTFEQRMSAPPPALSRRLLTSGSTGEPIEVVFPPGFSRWQGLMQTRSDLARGIMPWPRRASISLSPDRRPNSGVIGLFRRRLLALPLDLPADEMARRISAFGPKLLRGHPRLLLEVGDLLDGASRPRIGTWGETLDPLTRAALFKCYGSQPMDLYGTTEVGVVAWQCAQSDVYHLNHESVLVEILDEDDRPVPPGETGEVVLSGLGNPLMPFIRYRIGDLAGWSERPCKCGSKLPGLSSLQGRTLDWITAGDGTRVAPEHLWLTVRPSHPDAESIIPLVKRYQIKQLSSGTLTLRLELFQPAPQDLLNRIEEAYAEFLHVPVDLQVVDRLEDDGSIKFRLISSELVP